MPKRTEHHLTERTEAERLRDEISHFCIPIPSIVAIKQFGWG